MLKKLQNGLTGGAKILLFRELRARNNRQAHVQYCGRDMKLAVAGRRITRKYLSAAP